MKRLTREGKEEEEEEVVQTRPPDERTNEATAHAQDTWPTMSSREDILRHVLYFSHHVCWLGLKKYQVCWPPLISRGRNADTVDQAGRASEPASDDAEVRRPSPARPPPYATLRTVGDRRGATVLTD